MDTKFLKDREKSTIGKHPELSNLMCKKVCKQPEIPAV
jgi:hypothetical protein